MQSSTTSPVANNTVNPADVIQAVHDLTETVRGLNERRSARRSKVDSTADSKPATDTMMGTPTWELKQWDFDSQDFPF